MSDEIRNALTDTEWKDWTSGEFAHISLATAAIHVDRHALAALCLHQQPFGFDARDVAMLRYAADAFEKSLAVDRPPEVVDDTGWRNTIIAFRALADRIAALLPPPIPQEEK